MLCSLSSEKPVLLMMEFLMAIKKKAVRNQNWPKANS